MSQKDIANKILKLSIDRWMEKAVRISAAAIAEHISIPNDEVMKLMDELGSQGKGTLRSIVVLYQPRFDIESLSFEASAEPLITHIFFPSKKFLKIAIMSNQ